MPAATMFTTIYTTLVDFNPMTGDLILPIVAIGVMAATLYVGYIQNADSLLYYGLMIFRSLVGLRVKYIPRKGGKGVWCYAEKGQYNEKKQPTLVWLHGFGADKDTWPFMIRFISSKYHSIVIDMPGHGETTFVDELDELNIDGYVKSLKEFLELSGLDKEPVYLIGCSFGGAVAALFASKYPQNVAKLGLLCPALKTPVLTKTCKQLIDGNYSLLIPKNGKEFVTMIQLLANTRQPYPVRIMQAFVNINFTATRRIHLKKLLESLVVDEFDNFDKTFERLKALEVEALVVWGEDDEMLHISGAHMIKDNVRNSQLKLIRDCNHVIQLDQPRVASKALLKFLN